MTAWIDMEYPAELKHELKCMQKSHARQKEISWYKWYLREKSKPLSTNLCALFVTILNTGELI